MQIKSGSETAKLCGTAPEGGPSPVTGAVPVSSYRQGGGSRGTWAAPRHDRRHGPLRAGEGSAPGGPQTTWDRLWGLPVEEWGVRRFLCAPLKDSLRGVYFFSIWPKRIRFTCEKNLHQKIHAVPSKATLGEANLGASFRLACQKLDTSGEDLNLGRCVCLGHYARKMPFLDKTQWTGWHVEKGHPWEVGMGHHSYVLITNGAGNRPSECLIINRQVSQPVGRITPYSPAQ